MKLTQAQIQSARRHLRAADPVMQAMIDAGTPIENVAYEIGRASGRERV